MAKILTKLSDAQERLIPEFRDRFLGAGLSTVPADFTAAREAICDAYKIAGLEPPKIFIELRSPREGAFGAALLTNSKFGPNVRAQVWDQVGDQVRDQVWAQVRAQVWDQVGAQVWDQVRAQVGAQVRDQVGAQVGDQVWAQVRDQVWAQVRAQVWAQVGAQVWDQVGAQVWDQVGDQVRDQVWDQVRAQVGAQVRDQVGAQVGAQVRDQVGAQVGRAAYGQHDAGWLSFYAFFAEACGLECAKRLEPLTRLAHVAGWCWFFRGAAIITDRPSVLLRDEQHRLHSSVGPALEYRDGFGIFAWHGYRIPDSHSWIITDKARITADAIMSEPNAELRRIMCEITQFEPVRVIAKVIAEDADGNGNPRKLMTANVGGEEIRIVEVINGSTEPDGTRRKFLLGAMPGDTPHEVIAHSYGVKPEFYREACRT